MNEHEAQPFHIAEGMVLQRNWRRLSDFVASYALHGEGMPGTHLRIRKIRDDGYVEFDIIDGANQGWGCMCEASLITAEWFIPD